MKKLACLLWIALALTGCATAPDAIEPQTLAKASSAEVLHVKAISLRNDQIALAAGDYQAELEDANGTFYRGPGNCFRVIKDTYQGGIYIPRPPGPPKHRPYYYKTANSTPVSDGQAQQIANNTAPQAGIGAGAVGGALGAGIVNYMQTMNDGKLMLLQPIDGVNYPELVGR